MLKAMSRELGRMTNPGTKVEAELGKSREVKESAANQVDMCNISTKAKSTLQSIYYDGLS